MAEEEKDMEKDFNTAEAEAPENAGGAGAAADCAEMAEDAAEEGVPEEAKAEAEETRAEEANAPAEEREAEKKGDVDWRLQCARVMADFDNFRKRTERDREDLVKAAASDVIKDVLATVDNLSLALDKAKDKADDPFVKGVKLVYDELVKTLGRHGATPLDSLGEPFNADYHDALATLPSPDVEKDHVMNEVKRGWMLYGKLLRAAQVVVSSGKQA